MFWGPVKTNLYVDGFNFYFSSVRWTELLWVDFAALFRLVMPDDELNRIRYFTAVVKPEPQDRDKPNRQMAYLRALQTIPNLTVHRGNFVRQEHLHMRVHPPHEEVAVRYYSEKGSDVKMASYLLTDALENDCDQSAVLTNDSDLVRPVEMLTTRGHRVVIIAPPDRAAKQLIRAAGCRVRHYDRNFLRRSQFPDELFDANGLIHKPALWNGPRPKD